MLGRELVMAIENAGHTIVPLGGRSECDIADDVAVRAQLERVRPDALINAAAFTDVDGAETKYDEAKRVNGDGPGVLAGACRSFDCALIHYSTDYVFNGDGTTPYRTEDPVDPINAYGSSKLAGEQAIAQAGGRYAVLRTSWLLAAHGSNFLRTILRLAGERDTINVVDDQLGRPTSCPDLARMTVDLVEHILSHPEWTGRVLHAANDGQCSWYELAKMAVRYAGVACDVEPCGSDAFPRPARRPAYSVLDLSELTELIGPPRHWQPAVEALVDEILDCHTQSPTAAHTRKPAQ